MNLQWLRRQIPRKCLLPCNLFAAHGSPIAEQKAQTLNVQPAFLLVGATGQFKRQQFHDKLV
jgi:hypothetical protein